MTDGTRRAPRMRVMTEGATVMVAAEVVLFGEARRALRDAFLDEHGAGAPPGR